MNLVFQTLTDQIGGPKSTNLTVSGRKLLAVVLTKQVADWASARVWLGRALLRLCRRKMTTSAQETPKITIFGKHPPLILCLVGLLLLLAAVVQSAYINASAIEICTGTRQRTRQLHLQALLRIYHNHHHPRSLLRDADCLIVFLK